MRYACVVNGATSFHAFLDLVCEAEAAGWDAFFLPDGLAIRNIELFDPWVMMGAIAARTSRIRFGAMITPVSRRRPWKLAKECVTVDHLSNGRLIFAAGLGACPDDEAFGNVGEAVDIHIRAQRLDEGLEIIDGLWKGTEYSFSGKHFKVDRMAMSPRPLQQPRIPIWIVGVWEKPKSMQRAMAWDGLIPQRYNDQRPFSADDIRRIVEYAAQHRPVSKGPIDIISGGSTGGKESRRAAEVVKPFGEAGATWWVEFEPDLERIRQGPPR
jgi:alkanesulfonate monooxygenase SsuD/methylene tetrahydromethanopterin reductase-like flavin-dependent oxidoreductase (luciferase family)